VIRAVVFDLDGTLVDSTPDIAAGVNAALAERGFDPLPEETVHTFIGHGAEELIQRTFEAAGAPTDRATLDAGLEDYLRHYSADPAARTKVFSDAPEALAALAERGVAIGVCTNKGTDLSRRVLDAVGLGKAVAAVVGSDQVERRKPDPAHLIATLDALDARPEDAVYVGDSAVDAHTAAAAGVRLAMVDWGTGRDTEGPVWMHLERFADLLDATTTNEDGR
jgi:phosphoglycolate phosphatase